MQTFRKPLFALSGFALLLSCSSSIEPYARVELRTEATPSPVTDGDTLTLRAIMRNTSGAVIDLNSGCGPPVLFELRNALGEAVYPIPPEGVFTCEGRDYHVLEAYETDTVVVRWRTNLSPGPWTVRSGFRNGGNLERLSDAVAIDVRAGP